MANEAKASHIVHPALTRKDTYTTGNTGTCGLERRLAERERMEQKRRDRFGRFGGR